MYKTGGIYSSYDKCVGYVVFIIIEKDENYYYIFDLMEKSQKYREELNTNEDVNDVLENLPYLFSNSYIQSKLLYIPKDNVFFEQFDGYLGEISNKNLNFLLHTENREILISRPDRNISIPSPHFHKK